MTRVPRELTGMQFGRWRVMGRAPRQFGVAYWACICQCGVEGSVKELRLVNGESQSCGCYMREVNSRLHRTHGMKQTTEHKTWVGMLQRCSNPLLPDYHNYGGRGISVCLRWRSSFVSFYADMGPKPSPHHTLDRINVEGNYEPGNCRWATPTQQNRNRRNNRTLTYNDETLCLAEWAERTGFGWETLYNRIKAGWPTERVLTQPLRKARQPEN